MRTIRVAALLVLSLALMLVAYGQKPSDDSFLSWARHQIFRSTTLQVNAVCAASPAGGTACSECAGKCQHFVDDCKKGGQAACYRAAACLCQCNLDAGGCGSSREALQKCVDENTKRAKELE